MLVGPPIAFSSAMSAMKENEQQEYAIAALVFSLVEVVAMFVLFGMMFLRG